MWLDNKLLFNSSAPGLIAAPPTLPGYLPSQFAQVVRDDGKLFVRSAVTILTKNGKLTVVSSQPLDQRKLLNLATDLGEVTLYGPDSGCAGSIRMRLPHPALVCPLKRPPKAQASQGKNTN